MKHLPHIALALMILLPASLQAQRWKVKRYELGLGIGTTHILGDVGGSKNVKNWMGIRDVRLFNTRPSAAFNFRYRIANPLAAKFTFAYGNGYESDKNSTNESRGLVIHRQIFETSIHAEYYILTEDQRLSSTAMYYKRGIGGNFTRLGLYVFGGFGGAYTFGNIVQTNPAFEFNPDKETRKNFASTLVLPAGVGVKLMLNPDFSVGFEFGGRYCFSDYIDGYNAFGYSANKGNDIYYFTTFSAIYKLKNDRSGMPLFLKGLFSRSRGRAGRG